MSIEIIIWACRIWCKKLQPNKNLWSSAKRLSGNLRTIKQFSCAASMKLITPFIFQMYIIQEQSSAVTQHTVLRSSKTSRPPFPGLLFGVLTSKLSALLPADIRTSCHWWTRRRDEALMHKKQFASLNRPVVRYRKQTD